MLRSVIKRKLKHDLYKQCLFKKRVFTHTMRKIQGVKHKLYTLDINKISLSPFDDKKYFINELDNLAHGHFRIPHQGMINILSQIYVYNFVYDVTLRHGNACWSHGLIWLMVISTVGSDKYSV